MKKCFKCLRYKDADQFYGHPRMGSGRLGKCKSCTKKDVRENRFAKAEKYAAYERKRFREPHRRKQLAKYQKARRERTPGKIKARQAVCNAIRDGRLKRMPCLICGSKKSQAHHEDYRKPLAVSWLCFQHHREHHGQKVN